MVRAVAPLLLVLLAACGERVSQRDARSPAPDLTRVETSPIAPATPVRIGEAGPSFRACQAAGTPRDLASEQPLPVRIAPFEGANVRGAISPGARFFVCTRSIDQRWMGIVFEAEGTLSPGCGVSAPVPRRVAYPGPCGSGWVASALVRLVAQ